MSAMSISKMADLIMDTVGYPKEGEQRFTKQYVMEQVLAKRNHLQRIEARKAVESANDIADDWYTDRISAIAWDDVRQWHYIVIPNGNVVLPDDMGIRIMPIAGSVNPFVRFPTGMCRQRPDLAFCEGNIVWEMTSGRIVFPTMLQPYGDGRVLMQVIEDGPPDDIDSPMQMPAFYQATVMDMVLQTMGYSKGEDRKTDTKPGDSE